MKKNVLNISLFIVTILSHNALAKPETITLLRHSEKMAGRDPSLSDIGQQRAQSLVNEFSALAITHIFTTPYQRTEQTAAPIARARELPIQRYDPKELEAFAEQLLSLNGDIIVVGHSNTTPQLANHLANYPLKNWPETEFNTFIELASVKGGFKATEKQMGFGQTQKK